MQLSTQRKRYFVLRIMELAFNSRHRLSVSPEIGRKRFLALAFEAKLTDDPEELFYVGGLAERYYHGFLVNEDDQEWMRKV